MLKNQNYYQQYLILNIYHDHFQFSHFFFSFNIEQYHIKKNKKFIFEYIIKNISTMSDIIGL